MSVWKKKKRKSFIIANTELLMFYLFFSQAEENSIKNIMPSLQEHFYTSVTMIFKEDTIFPLP